MDIKQRQKLKKIINELKQIKARHTQLISVYIPQGYELIKIIGHLQQEQSTASNIQDKTTRNNVLDGLEKMVRHLRLYKKTPDNGLAVFAGNISPQEGKPDIKVFSIEPADPINIRKYRCDQVFDLEVLEGMLEHKDIYGLIVMDNREANIGLLKGTSITLIKELSSNVPGKVHVGGFCLHPDTLVVANDGDIVKIKNLHNPYVIKSFDFEDNLIKDSAIIDKWDNGKKEAYKIITQTPRIEIESSKDHIFFVFDNEIKEKKLVDLKKGDYLLMPEKIDIKGKVQTLKTKVRLLPKVLNEDLAQTLGYVIGDGYIESTDRGRISRINLYERDKETIYHYKKLLDNLFRTKAKVKFKKNKNYYELRLYGKPIIDFIKKEFPEVKKSFDTLVPEKVLKSKDNIVASFLKGLFDAEGYVTKEELAIGMSNKILIQQMHFLLLRLGIIASICKYNFKKATHNTRYTIRITDKPSLELFKARIGFTFSDKRKKLDLLIKNRTNKNNMRQILISGREVRKIIGEEGLLKENFTKVSNFFYNQRQMSKYTFKSSILNVVKNNKKLYNRLKKVLDINLIPVKIKEIQKLEKKIEMIDISVKNKNFIANGILVHNSQQRYARLREEAAHEFYKKIAVVVNKEFTEIKELKGILLGGSGPTKETFLDGDYIHTEVKKKIIGVKDLSYTGEFGLKELVDRSKDVIAEQEITKEKELIKDFLERLGKSSNKATYGRNAVKKALEYGAVETLLLSEELDAEEIEWFEEEAKKYGTEVKIIGMETDEGKQFRDLSGIGAILRFAVT